MKKMNVLLAAAAALLAVAPQARAQTALDKLQIHGYLNQGLTRSDSKTLPIFGISDTVGGDYRRMAVQFRYELTPQDVFVVQIGNSRMGSSPITAGQKSALIDWAFVAHEFSHVTVRAGRQPLTEGIYNEIRSVGTLLPFYRAPGMFYMEGKESFDGVSAATALPLARWRLVPSLDFGTVPVKYILYTPDPKLMDTAVQAYSCGWLWLETPVPGVRVGYGLETWHKKGLDLTAPAFQHVYQHASVDATFERYYFRAEARKLHTKFDENAAYVQSGVAIAPTFWLNAQGEWLRNTVHVPHGPTNVSNNRDLALGTNWKPNANFSVKLEGHSTFGKQYEVLMTKPAAATYGIASVAVGF